MLIIFGKFENDIKRETLAGNYSETEKSKLSEKMRIKLDFVLFYPSPDVLLPRRPHPAAAAARTPVAAPAPPPA